MAGENFKDIAGQRFGSWTVTSRAPNESKSGKTSWNVVCDCGATKQVRGQSLRSGESSQCYACMHRTHGDSANGLTAPEYNSWAGMIQRCTNEKHPKFSDYGGRGVMVCDRWLNSYENFLSDVGRRPAEDYSLDRYPDVNGGYEPTNVRWANAVQQANNRRPRRTGYHRRSENV